MVNSGELVVNILPMLIPAYHTIIPCGSFCLKLECVEGSQMRLGLFIDWEEAKPLKMKNVKKRSRREK